MLIAALISAKGAPRELLVKWLSGDFELLVSPVLVSELERVLLRPKFRQYVTERDSRSLPDPVPPVLKPREFVGRRRHRDERSR